MYMVMFLAEKLHFHKSASIAFVWTNTTNTYYKQKEQTRKMKFLESALFSVSDVFANAKVMLCCA